MNNKSPSQGSGGNDELVKMREFAYRAPSPDSEPPTMQEEEESQETEGAAAAQSLASTTERDSSPDDLEESQEAPASSGKIPKDRQH